MTDGKLLVARETERLVDTLLKIASGRCGKCGRKPLVCRGCGYQWCNTCEPIPSCGCDEPTHVDDLEAL